MFDTGRVIYPQLQEIDFRRDVASVGRTGQSTWRRPSATASCAGGLERGGKVPARTGT
jgi:hypothetical protein